MSKTKAIVLHSFKYGERKIIIDLLTNEYGRLSFICSVPKTSKAKVKKQFFMPLNILNIEFDYRSNLQFQHLRDAGIAYPLSNISTDQYKLAICFFMAEFINYATRGEKEKNTTLFIYIEKSIIWLDNADGCFSNFHICFILHFARFIGFSPNLGEYADGAYFDLREGSFTMSLPVHRDVILPQEASKINIFMGMDYSNMGTFSLSHDERNRIVDIILKYYQLHVPNFPDMKSLEILRTLF